MAKVTPSPNVEVVEVDVVEVDDDDV